MVDGTTRLELTIICEELSMASRKSTAWQELNYRKWLQDVTQIQIPAGQVAGLTDISPELYSVVQLYHIQYLNICIDVGTL